MKNNISKFSIGFIAMLLFGGQAVLAQSTWRVTDVQAKIMNPIAADEASIKEGKVLFTSNCKTCHGDPGKNNGLPLVPKPTDFANAAFLSINSDGAIFTKMTEGKGIMPTFKAVLSETERWKIVDYIRSLDANKKVVTTITATNKKAQLVRAPYQISLTYNPDENTLKAFVEGTSENGILVPASGLEVGFFIKRYFGKLPFGNSGGVTDENGLIEAPIPTDLPGGEEGKAVAFVLLSNTDAFGSVSAELEVNVKPIKIVNLLDQRSLWTVRVMAPWWLILTYFGILIGVWSTLGYVVFQLFKLKKARV